jgi:hypothetical protein
MSGGFNRQLLQEKKEIFRSNLNLVLEVQPHPAVRLTPQKTPQGCGGRSKGERKSLIGAPAAHFSPNSLENQGLLPPHLTEEGARMKHGMSRFQLTACMQALPGKYMLLLSPVNCL